MTFSGVLTALVTPFDDRGVDEAAFRALVRRQLDAGIHGLVPCGTTGEAPTLSIAEHTDVIRWTVEEAAGKVPVLAGIGSNNTAQAIETGKRAADLGVQGVLATAPYYNKPTQEGLFRHFEAIADAVDAEVCVYDVPGRSVVEVEASTLERLSAHARVTTVKDATGDLVKATELTRRLPADFSMLSGDDFTSLPFWMLGGHGCISVASNLVPDRMVAMHAAATRGDLPQALAMNRELLPLFRVLFVETNPQPVKTALAALGLCLEKFRLPLCEMSASGRAALFEELHASGILEDAG